MVFSKQIEFKTHLQSSLVSLVNHDSKEYMIAPCTAIVAGVLNRALVPIDVISNTYQLWNGRPFVLNHPYDENGVSISANTPHVLANVGLGHIWNSHIEGDRLKVDVWLDIQKCENLGGDAQRVIDMVGNGDPLEISTGYFAHMRNIRGVFNGQEYDETTEMILSDHLAALPNSKGACGWHNGCGIPRTNQQGGNMDERTLIEAVTDSFKKFIPYLAVQNAATKGMCEACAAVHIQAEEDEPKPEPGQNPEPETEPVENPEPEGIPNKDGGDKPEREEEVMADVTTQQADTLSMFLNEHRISRDNLIEAIQLRNNRRKEWADVVKTNANLSDEDVIGMSDKVLEQLAQTYAARPIEGQPVVNHSQAAFVGRGFPVSQSTERTVEPLRRPQVLVNKRDREAS